MLLQVGPGPHATPLNNSSNTPHSSPPRLVISSSSYYTSHPLLHRSPPPADILTATSPHDTKNLRSQRVRELVHEALPQDALHPSKQ